MGFLEFKKRLSNQPFFSIQAAKLIFPKVSSVQLTRWQQKGYIQSIIRGWYYFTDVPVTEALLQLISNKIVPHSYISLEYGLSFYHLIPEGVFQITAITTKKTQQFDTRIATFHYRHVKPLFMFGYKLQKTPYGQVCIAEVEKTILDFLYLTPEANSNDYFSEMRLNKEVLKKLDRKKFKHYLAVFGQEALSQRAKKVFDYAVN